MPAHAGDERPLALAVARKPSKQRPGEKGHVAGDGDDAPIPAALGELEGRDHAAERVQGGLGLDQNLTAQARQRSAGLGHDDRRHGALARRRERVTDQRAVAQLGERLGLAEPRPAPARQHRHHRLRRAHRRSVALH